ncbi:vinexin isoform X4 [Apus apus]|uniref:vinexin isoform X4 n=1 Tax=Apus apus TaxID=8895 RepID=UPI0021F8F152|nr:vinexin isoform X4 [Apus apus]
MASGPWMRLGCPSPHARVSTAPATGTAACSGSSTAGCQSQTGTPTTAPRGSAAPRPPQCPPPPPDPRRKGPSPTKSPGIPNGLDWTGWGDTGATAEPGSIFDYEPGKSSVLEQEQQPPAAVPLGWAQPIEVLLAQELEQLSKELDKDMRAMETRRHPCKSSAAAPAAPSPAPASPPARSPLSPRGLQTPPWLPPPTWQPWDGAGWPGLGQ